VQFTEAGIRLNNKNAIVVGAQAGATSGVKASSPLLPLIKKTMQERNEPRK
jgi:hypothetical protein